MIYIHMKGPAKPGLKCDYICIFFNESCLNLVRLPVTAPPGLNVVIIKIGWGCLGAFDWI